MVRLVQAVVIDEVRPVNVEQRTKRQPVVPAGGKVSHVDVVVARRLPLAPQQQALLCAEALLVDVVDCESQDQRPDQAEYDFAVPVNDVLGPNVGRLYAPPLYEIERFVDVFKPLDAQFRL
jgi:hypothetical protein